jgi:hypothetical protein
MSATAPTGIGSDDPGGPQLTRLAPACRNPTWENDLADHHMTRGGATT